MPWREIEDDDESLRTYKVLVSEIMLQQTQVSRVQDKYIQWMARWPSNTAYQQATLADTLTAWSGLGYNRRAKYLLQSLRTIHIDYNDLLPTNVKELCSLPGVGINTANALLAYVYNQPVSFIETNIRSVYIHHFFTDYTTVTDTEILDLVNKTMDKNNPREWYWALMDYGSYLKKSKPSVLHKSLQHKKQKPFMGSVRQLRGAVIKELTNSNNASISHLTKNISDNRLQKVLLDLIKDELVAYDKKSKLYRLAQ